MAVPAAKIKEICTAEEAKLVRASRKPELEKLSAAELKKHAAVARKLYDKWLALGREQSRAKSKKVGFGESPANTKLKTEAFGDALKAFEDQLAKQPGTAAPKKKAVTKKKRNADHRANRSNVRQELSEMKESLKEPARKAAKKKAVKKVSAKKKVAQKKVAEPVTAEEPVKKAVKRTRPKTAPVGNPGLNFDKGKARQAKTAAKQARLDRSGVTSRMRGHTMVRGQRAQARRDSKG